MQCMIKQILTLAALCISILVKSQKIEKIFVNLYTDSLKKGTYNYINIDGQLADGKYIPLDSTHIVFWASEGKFMGNNLWIDKDFTNESVFIKVMAKGNPALNKEFTIFIKKKPDDEKLKSEEELLEGMKSKKKKN